MNVYFQPDKRHAYAHSGTNLFTPVERELVFDIVSFNILSRIAWNWFWCLFLCVFFLSLDLKMLFSQDITDYDDVRYCCSGADVCSKCWPLMTVAIKVIDTSLRGITIFFLTFKYMIQLEFVVFLRFSIPMSFCNIYIPCNVKIIVEFTA